MEDVEWKEQRCATSDREVGPLGDKVVGVVTYDECLVSNLTCCSTSSE